MKQEVKRVAEALKFNNSRLLEVERLQEAIYSFLSKAPEFRRVETLESAVEKMASNMNRLTEILSKLGTGEDPEKFILGQKKLGDYVR